MCDCLKQSLSNTYNCSNCGGPIPCPTDPSLPCTNPVLCDETISSDCITFPSVPQQSCSGIKNGDSLSTVINKIDARICQCCGINPNTISALQVFYVDGNNTNSGDGSILNPYQSIDLAYSAVLGSGTVDAPQHQNIAVSVAAYSYTTAQNIYLGYTTYIFADGATVNFTGSGYFIDTSVVTLSPGVFKVAGGLQFKTATGGFINNTGVPTNGATSQKQVYVEVFSIWGGTSASGATPLIVLDQTTSEGYGALSIELSLKNESSTIYSATESIIKLQGGGYFSLNLNGGLLGYGYNAITGSYAGTAGRNAIYYNCTDSSVSVSIVKIGNGGIFTLNNTDMISVSGYYGIFELHELRTDPGPNNQGTPNTFITIGTVGLSSSSATVSDNRFLLRDLYLNPNNFNSATVIKYTGSGTLTGLELKNCVLYGILTVGTNISIGSASAYGPVSASINIIRGFLHVAQLQTYASNAAALTGGLLAGDIYTNGTGSLQIVY